MTDSTSSHPSRDRPDGSTNRPRRFSSSSSSSTPQLPRLQVTLQQSLRQFPDFPAPGILFEDILPIFQDPSLHQSLITALELYIVNIYGWRQIPDIIIGLEARGFLFGPSLALRLSAGFVPIRKKGKLPGPVETASYTKEYGEDHFQIQSDSIKKGQKVLIVDDIIATGGTAAAAESLVEKLGGVLLGHVFILELGFLKGRDKLKAPVHTLLTGQTDGTHQE